MLRCTKWERSGILQVPKAGFFRGVFRQDEGNAMAPVNGSKMLRSVRIGTLMALAVAITAIPALQAQSGSSPSQSQPPTNSQPAQDIPDAPSTVQPPPPPKPAAPEPSTTAPRKNEPIPFPGDVPERPNQAEAEKNETEQQQQSAASLPADASRSNKGPKNQLNPKEDLYTISVPVNFVQIPVMVKDANGRRVDGLLPKDFIVKENGKPQNLTYFTSDPFELSVAVVIDTGMSDVALQKVNQTYTALAGAFSPYDEVALYTYSSTVSQVTDFTGKPARLIAALNEMKTVRGNGNGPPVLSGPFGPEGPTVNGLPAGGPPVPPVYNAPREAHVLNDAILQAALDLSKRDRTRRKVIFVISDGREMGSKASYNEVRRLLQTRDIQVRAVVVDSGALPVYRQLGKLHIPDQGHNLLLPKYVNATCGEEDLDRLSRNAIEDAYGQITNEARNQYTLGYSPKPTTGASAYRSVEVVVEKRGLKVSAKDGYYPTSSAH
jgi:VWFA-related protein